MSPHGALGMLDRGGAMFARSNTNRVFDVDDEDLAVADLAMVASSGGFRKLVDHCLHDFRLHHRLDLEPRNQRDVNGSASILFRVSTLRAAALDLGHSDARDTALVEDVLHFLQPLVANDRNYHLHAGDPSWLRAEPPTRSADPCGLTVGVSAGR